MAIGALQTIRNGMIVIGMCASLAVGSLGFAGSAEARVPSTAVGETAAFCLTLQDGYDRAIGYAAEAASSGDTAAYSYWINVASAYAKRWNNSECYADYGSVVARRAPGEASVVVEVSTLSPEVASGGRSPARSNVAGHKFLAR